MTNVTDIERVRMDRAVKKAIITGADLELFSYRELFGEPYVPKSVVIALDDPRVSPAERELLLGIWKRLNPSDDD